MAPATNQELIDTRQALIGSANVLAPIQNSANQFAIALKKVAELNQRLRDAVDYGVGDPATIAEAYKELVYRTATGVPELKAQLEAGVAALEDGEALDLAINAALAEFVPSSVRLLSSEDPTIIVNDIINGVREYWVDASSEFTIPLPLNDSLEDVKLTFRVIAGAANVTLGNITSGGNPVVLGALTRVERASEAWVVLP
jgi:hypothetical protein